jgi:hypothetical protein
MVNAADSTPTSQALNKLERFAGSNELCAYVEMRDIAVGEL